MRFPAQYVARYARRNPVKGWLAPFSTEVIARLSMRQLSVGIRGGLAEIGVHHGKLFFVLYLTSAADETALAIDVFAAQHLNIDKSGRGDKGIFLDHARRWSATLEGLKIIEDSSLNLVPDQILAACGRVRMFSIDGAHTEEATINDIRLAEAVLLQDGIVILDDCFNEAWPEVCAGVANYICGEHKLVPFAITPGKVMFCSPHKVGFYAGFLRSSFPQRVDKTARFFGHEVPLIGVVPWTLKRRLGRTKVGMILKQFLARV